MGTLPRNPRNQVLEQPTHDPGLPRAQRWTRRAPPWAAGTGLTRPHRLHQDHAVPADCEAKAMLVLLDDDAALNETWARGRQGAGGRCGRVVRAGEPGLTREPRVPSSRKTGLVPPHRRATTPPPGVTAPHRPSPRGTAQWASLGVPAPPGAKGRADTQHRSPSCHITPSGHLPTPCRASSSRRPQRPDLGTGEGQGTPLLTGTSAHEAD